MLFFLLSARSLFLWGCPCDGAPSLVGGVGARLVALRDGGPLAERRGAVASIWHQLKGHAFNWASEAEPGEMIGLLAGLGGRKLEQKKWCSNGGGAMTEEKGISDGE